MARVEVTMIRRNALITAFALVSALSGVEPILAQQIERLANCEEVMTVGPILIGHNCGEFASILINGRIIIRRPWSRVNRASRAERLRLRGGRAAPTVETTTPPTTSPSGPTPAGDFNCDDFTYQEDAQAYFDSQGWSATNDPFGLDDDDDGIPCESLPTRRG